MLSLFYMQGALDWDETVKKSLREWTTIPYTFIVIILLGPCHRLFMIALKFPICIIGKALRKYKGNDEELNRKGQV